MVCNIFVSFGFLGAISFATEFFCKCIVFGYGGRQRLPGLRLWNNVCGRRRFHFAARDVLDLLLLVHRQLKCLLCFLQKLLNIVLSRLK